MAYGMKSSVVNFSRFLTLCTGIAGRTMAALAASYVDNFTVIDVVDANGSRQARLP